MPVAATCVLHTIMPAPGWQVVYWWPDGHCALPLHALALVERQGERAIVGLRYDLTYGWEPCDEAEHYCGLLPPEETLTHFYVRRGCRHEEA